MATDFAGLKVHEENYTRYNTDSSIIECVYAETDYVTKHYLFCQKGDFTRQN